MGRVRQAYPAVVVAATVTGFVIAALVVVRAGLTPVSGMSVTLALLSAGVLIGELGLIPVPGRDDEDVEITMSTPFVVALLATGPLAWLMLVHSAALALDDLRSRRSPVRVLSNVGQSLLALAAARGVYAITAGMPYLGGYVRLTVPHVLPALLGGLTFLMVSRMLVALNGALHRDEPLREVFRADMGATLEASVVLIGLGPLAGVVADTSGWLLPLLVLPVLAVRRSAVQAAQRHRQAQRDALTGLSNREHFFARTRRHLDQYERTAVPMSVLMVDLDHFKEINDTLGHQVGDELIQSVAERIRCSTHDEAVCVARLGGDEFAVLLTRHDAGAAAAVAATVLDSISQSLQIAATRLSVQASIGVALAEPGMDVSTMMKRADIALYEAKRERARSCVFDPDAPGGTPERLSLITDLREAVHDGALTVVFQPQVSVMDGAVVGAEALARWRHPERGPIPPEEFIALAENAGLISQITDQVLEASLLALQEWNEAGISAHVSVNLSARQLSDLSLPERLGASLERHRLDPHQLTIEVTESSIMGDPRRAGQILRELRSLGIRVAIDDFGTGYSSLVYLRSLDLDEIKIDRSFIHSMSSEVNDLLLVRSIVELGHNLGLSVVAEGVEDADQFVHLRDLGCDTVQGFYVGRPMDRAAMRSWMQEDHRLHPGGLPHRHIRTTPLTLLPRILSDYDRLQR